MKRKNRTSVILSTAALLLCLVLVSSYFSSGMLARYVTRANGTDSARVAPLKVSAVLTEEEQGRTYTVTLRNDSGVAVRFEAAPELSLPEGATGSAVFAWEDSQAGEDVREGELTPGATLALTLTVDLSGISLSALAPTDDAFPSFSNGDISTAAADLPVTVTVTFTQID